MRIVSIVALKKRELLESESQKFQDTFFANWLSCIYGTTVQVAFFRKDQVLL